VLTATICKQHETRTDFPLLHFCVLLHWLLFEQDVLIASLPKRSLIFRPIRHLSSGLRRIEIECVDFLRSRVT
jgi:hypothetical protein